MVGEQQTAAIQSKSEEDKLANAAWRWQYLALSCCLCLLCGGAVFGFSILEGPLADAGAFIGDCSEPGCDEQRLSIGTVYTVASVSAFIFAVAMGAMLDRFGPKVTVAVSTAGFSAGALLVAVALTTKTWWLLYPGIGLFGVMSQGIIAPLVPTSNLFPGSEAMAISVINGAFDGSVLVFLCLKEIGAAGSNAIGLEGAFFVYAGVCAALCVAVIAILPNQVFVPHEIDDVLNGVIAEKVVTSMLSEEESTKTGRQDSPKDSKSPRVEPSSSGSSGPDSKSAPSPGQPQAEPATLLQPSHSVSGSVPSTAQQAPQDRSLELVQAAKPAVSGGGPPSSSKQPRDSAISVFSLPEETAPADDAADALGPSATKGDSSPRLAWGSSEHRREGEQEKQGREQETRAAELTVGAAAAGAAGIGGGASTVTKTHGEKGGPAAAPTGAAVILDASSSSEGEGEGSDGSKKGESEGGDKGEDEEEYNAAAPSQSGCERFLETIQSPVFIGYALFFATNSLFYNYYFLTLGTRLQANALIAEGEPTDLLVLNGREPGPEEQAALDDAAAEAGRLLDIFGILLPASAVVVFLTGYIMDTAGLVYAFYGLVCVTVTFQAVAMVPDPPMLQLATFMLFAVFRAFMFGSLGTFLITEFGAELVGKLVAVIVPFGGLISLLQYPLFQQAMQVYKADFTVTSGSLIGLAVLSVAFPIGFGYLHGYKCRYVKLEEERQRKVEAAKKRWGRVRAAVPRGAFRGLGRKDIVRVVTATNLSKTLKEAAEEAQRIAASAAKRGDVGDGVVDGGGSAEPAGSRATQEGGAAGQ